MFNMVKTHLALLFQLGLPVIIAYLISPTFTLSPLGMITISFIIGGRTLYKQYHASLTEARTLAYAPSQEFLERFKQEVKTCGLDPEAISFGYSYLFDKVAISLFKTIKIDPLLWKNIENDPIAIKITKVLNEHILPSEAEHKKMFQAAINQHLTPQAQCFILRHELGHIAHDDSWPRLISVSTIVTLVVLVGMAVAAYLLPIVGGVAALFFALCAAMIADLTFSALNNKLINAMQEQRADLFAAQYSTDEEITAAGNFFKAFDVAASEHIQHKNQLEYLGLPNSFSKGYYTGAQRAAYLQKYVDERSQK